MNKKYICILFILCFYSCEFKLLEEPETPSWYLPLTVPLIDTEYGFEGILQEGVLTSTAEYFDDCGSDNDCDYIDENGTQGNGQWDQGEYFIDENGNDIWDEYGSSDSLLNMIQMEFNSEFDSIGLNVVEEQLGMNFFKVDLSDITIPPTIIQEASTYDLAENLPNPLMDPTVIPVEIEIPESENALVNAILESCSEFIPDNEQNLSIPVDLSTFPDPIELATEEISEPIVVEVPLDIDMDVIDLGDLGEITVEKIILSDDMEWEVAFRNGLPFIIESLNFNIYKGSIENNDKLTSLIIENISPYTNVTDYISFESYELTLDASLFAEIEIIVSSEQLPPEDCDLNICVSDAISIDQDSGELVVDENGFSVYGSTLDCSNNCDPCFGEDIFVCVADAIDENGNVVGDPMIYQGLDSQIICEGACNSCLDFTVAVCVADAVDASGNIIGDPTTYQGENAQTSCESDCSPCLDLTTSVCVADAIDENGNVSGDPTAYQGPDSQTDCEALCDPCLEQVTYVCPMDGLPYNTENECDNACFVDCISASIYACTTTALDSEGNVDTDLVQTYETSEECEASCSPCFVEPIHACTTDAIDENGNVLDEDLDGDGVPDAITIYPTSQECTDSCEPCFNASIYVCTTESAITDGNDNTDPTQYSSNAECIASGCASCIEESLSGWQIQDDEITFDLDGELILETLVVNLEINDTPEADPISVDFPSFDQVQVREALIDDGTSFDDFGLDGEDGTGDEGENDEVAQEYETQYSNEFNLNINNGFFGEANLNLTFSNIYQDDEPYSESVTLEPESTLNQAFNLSNKRIGDKDEGVNLENIEINYDFSIQNGQYSIPLEDNTLSIGEIGYSASVSNLKLLSISAITEEIDFPQVQSVPLQDIPAGFDDFKLYDIFMDMNIYNEITINTVSASFSLIGKKCPQGMDADACFSDDSIEGKNFPFNINLDSPNRREDNPCGYEVGDVAITRIAINKDSQITRYFCSEEDIEPYEEIEEEFDGEDNVSLLDFIYFGPNQMNMNGGVLIDGEGTLRENDRLWGDFAIAAPLAFVFDEDLIIIPQDITTINAMDEELSNKIDSSLVEAEFNAEITNNSPLGMSMSMLISDNTIFPLYLDDLDNLDPHCLNEAYIDEESCTNNEFTWVNYQDSLSELGVSSISFETINSLDDRAYYVEFFEEDEEGLESLMFWIGRVMDVSFVPPLETDDNGFVTIPSVYFSTDVLDATRVSWVTANEERYMVPMIRLASSNGNPSSLQTTNYLGVRSFLTFILDTEGLSRKNKKIITKEQSTPDSSQ